ncbi:FGGY carbohydrate kinase domain-containing protein-like [Orbicella faveolata]|uniref:FGGY carbohydrate kinase domain-containing protein-like n=1 Tax=Orbicella faveolata TaxID=48498 RepID=UPI0009E33F04|nr:FGGY carbohydrate kinase domain-containing protein-like [Orbicella faveolata]
MQNQLRGLFFLLNNYCRNAGTVRCTGRVRLLYTCNRSNQVARTSLQICGLTLTVDLDGLAVLYLATLQALAHGTRHIIESMNKAGHFIDTLSLCGGLTKNELFIQTHADVTGFPCVLPRESESVLVGSAILGACASGDFTSIQVGT